ncbi:unnamed protein product [Rotaria sordida]|uniref:Uncharacterized protein n=1 Tax=Rotaria sordida TaxID=392033 RepID=A0A819G9R8_9BILA|nr:unnamed protein product [Rotaria sordida]CAF3878096.1 unnamed protein product [Rotaria sordida]
MIYDIKITIEVPVSVVWRNPRTKSLLLRGSAFFNKGSSSDTNASIEQEHYFDVIVKLIATKMSFSTDLGDDDESESRIN